MAISFPSFPLYRYLHAKLQQILLCQFILSSPNPCLQEMVGVGGMWNQISLESKCKVSIWEYPVGGSCVCSRGWEGREECWLPEPPCTGLPGHRNSQSWCLAPSRGHLWGAGLLFGLSSQLIAPGPQLIPWSKITASGSSHYCCAFATSQTPVGSHSTCQRGVLDIFRGPRPQVTLSFQRATEEHRWKISK